MATSKINPVALISIAEELVNVKNAMEDARRAVIRAINTLQ